MGNAILKGQTGGASPTIITQKRLTLLADVTIYSARLTVDFTGLNIGADTELLLVSTLVDGSGMGPDYRIYVNGVTTNTSYYCQYTLATGTSVQSQRTNYPFFSGTYSSSPSLNVTNIKLSKNNWFTYQNKASQFYGSSNISSYDYRGTYMSTISSITQLTISSTISSGIGVGSRFQLYSLNTGGEKTWVTS